MDWFSDKEITQLWVTIIGGLIAGLAVLLVVWLFKVLTLKALWNGVWPRLKAWYNRITLYSHLSACDRDILKALYEGNTTLISLHYDDGRPPSIQTKLDHILDTPVACRLMVSDHYKKSLSHLRSHNFLKVDGRWQYNRQNPYPTRTQSYELTRVGHEFIRKHTIGFNARERFIRKWFRGLGKHKYDGHYCNDVGKGICRELPRLLQGTASLKKHFGKAGPIGSNRDNVKPDVYEYTQENHEDGVEWMVAVPFLHVGDQYFDVAQYDHVILWIHTDEWIREQEIRNAAMGRKRLKEFYATISEDIPVMPSVMNRASRPPNKPRYLEFSQKLVGHWEAYPIQAKVITIEESDDPAVTVLKLGEPKIFDPSTVLDRNQSAKI